MGVSQGERARVSAERHESLVTNVKATSGVVSGSGKELRDDYLMCSRLQKDPNDRPQDATEVLKRIDDCHVTGTWSSERAHAWWLKHLPNRAGTLTAGLNESNPM